MDKTGHRMFCHVTQSWQGKPLVSNEVIVNLIAATTTGVGLTIRSDIDENDYATGVKVTDDQMERAIDPADGLPWRAELYLHTAHLIEQGIFARLLSGFPLALAVITPDRSTPVNDLFVRQIKFI